MPARYSWQRAAAITFLALPLSWQAERRIRSMPRLEAWQGVASLPSLSIIVPARNEEHNLRHLLPSLQAIHYPGPYEIIVVDDNSTDRTAEVAAAHSARVLKLNHLPAGWKGKPHACHHGARAAQGEWLLFTDADTRHDPSGPARAVAYALRHELDGLSLLLQQECHGVIDRLALTAAFAALFAGIDPQNTLFNGQYILVRRSVYVASGGFAAVRAEALEDVAYGQHLRRLGYKTPVLLGENAARVRMYENALAVWHGMNRLGADSLRWSGLRSLATALFVTALISPLVALLGIAGGKLQRRWLPATWAATTVSMVSWADRFGLPWWALAAPFGALFVQLAALWGILNRLIGRGVRWKERRV